MSPNLIRRLATPPRETMLVGVISFFQMMGPGRGGGSSRGEKINIPLLKGGYSLRETMGDKIHCFSSKHF